jgi:hypothetical protein
MPLSTVFVNMHFFTMNPSPNGDLVQFLLPFQRDTAQIDSLAGRTAPTVRATLSGVIYKGLFLHSFTFRLSPLKVDVLTGQIQYMG